MTKTKFHTQPSPNLWLFSCKRKSLRTSSSRKHMVEKPWIGSFGQRALGGLYVRHHPFYYFFLTVYHRHCLTFFAYKTMTIQSQIQKLLNTIYSCIVICQSKVIILKFKMFQKFEKKKRFHRKTYLRLEFTIYMYIFHK